MKLIQDELKRVAEHWNVHKIRPSLNSDCPAGRPDVLYFLPELMETLDCSTQVPDDEMEVAEQMCCEQNIYHPAYEPFVDLAHIIMNDENLRMPEDAEEALSLYIDLLCLIEMFQ